MFLLVMVVLENTENILEVVVMLVLICTEMRIGLGIKTLLLVAAVLMVAKFVQHRFGRQSDDAKTLKAYNDFKVKFNKHTSSE